MTRLTRCGLAACVGLTMVVAGCGKKGNPLPPLRPVPARIADLTAVRTTGQVELRFTVPNANLDGTTPVTIDRVDIFGIRATEGQTPPPAGQVADERYLLTSLPVRRPVTPGVAEPDTPVSTLVPLPGETVTYVDRTQDAEQAGAVAMFYVAVPATGTGRGRSGPPTPVASVPLGAFPDTPSNLALGHDETNVTATWTAPAEGLTYRIFRVSAGSDAQGGQATTELLTAEPLKTAEFSLPAAFGREVCLAVQAVQVSGAVITAGAASERVCLTPVDRYPPPAPGGVRVVQEGAAVAVLWDAVDSADLAGYIVLRGEGTGASLTRLVSAPIVGTTYRDTTAVAGATYSYAVQAVDSAPTPNVSPASAREIITVR